MMPTQGSKWEALIDQIKRSDTISEKVDLLATMVFMLATNDMSCFEERLNKLANRVYFIGIGLFLLIFSGIDLKTAIGWIVKLAK